MINIFRGTFSEVMNIRNLLEDNNIEVFTENEYMSNIQPWIITAGGFNPMILKVNNEDFETAQKIIADFENGSLSIEQEPEK
jgi:hypothetical protein